tara:strand:- start:33763 stop:34209 length:447 start_codon:yes stop_codon:yes gene_type:complete
MQFLNSLQANLKIRPHWMNALMLFCAYMTFIYLPWDIFLKPLAEDQEVWFGLLFTGWAAKAGGILHWYVYGAGFWGLWKMRTWMFPWAALYTAQIAVGMFVWSYLDDRGSGVTTGLMMAIPFLALAVALWRTSYLRTAEEPADSLEPE